jgi:beta-lactamase superfamily II metal-dependent hydrolase
LPTSSTDAERLVGPAVDTLEVSLFGPGKGECVVVHAGYGDWFVIDSCVDQVGGGHPALEYLEGIGVAVESQIRLVVATHAHDDHIAGIAELFRRAKSARFVLSSAATSEEFFAVVEADVAIEATLRQSVRREYRAVLEEVKRRASPAAGPKPALRAYQSRVLWERAADGPELPARMIALSPSDEAIDRAQLRLASSLATVDNRRKLASGDPNELAVAIWVECGEASALLGADLISGPKGCGWDEATKTYAPTTRARIYKVAHHGSPNAHHNDIWTKLLGATPIHILTPFRAGRHPRPSSSDLSRLALLGRTFLSASPRSVSPNPAVKRAAASLAGIASGVRDPWGRVGQVRARWDLETRDWKVETFAPAREV